MFVLIIFFLLTTPSLTVCSVYLYSEEKGPTPTAIKCLTMFMHVEGDGSSTELKHRRVV